MNNNIYKVAIVGRPNVGKSALVNRLCQNDEAIVHERRGVTRDRTYHDCDWNGLGFSIIDTGGLEISDDDIFKSDIRNNALLGADEADVILFLVDGKVGVQSDDEDVAKMLRRVNKPVFLCVNKLDDPSPSDEVWQFCSLGFGNPWPISALHGHGTGDLLDEVVSELKKISKDKKSEVDEGECINVAIIGRPNAGKSTLMNALTANKRSIVSDVAGTTRDSIDTVLERNGQKYRIIDTAGLRRKAKIDDNIEYYSFVRAMRSIERADVAILVVDATLGATNEDQRVANFANESHCALAIALNKWDKVSSADDKARVRADVDEILQFVNYVKVQSICALTGKKVDKIWDLIDQAYLNYVKQISTSKLNDWLSDVRSTGHTISAGKTVLRLKYMTQSGIKPPTFQVFCNRADAVTQNYKRFLENKFRESFDLGGTPIKMFFR